MTIRVSDRRVWELKTTACYAGANFMNFSNFFKILQSPIDENSLLYKYITEEYNQLCSEQNNFPFIANIYENQNFFLKSFDTICATIEKYFDGEISLPKLFIVDELPGEFKNMPWTAMFIDEIDAIRINIPHGVYYKKSGLIHPFYDFIIAHELVHWIISHYTKNEFPHTNLIEEGLCDLLSYLILIDSGLITKKELVNYLIYNRAIDDQNSIWNNYFKFSKFILNNVFSQGTDYLFQIIREGRDHVNALEFLINDSFVSEKNINILLKAYNEAESTVFLDIECYALLKTIISNDLTIFNGDEIIFKDFNNDLLIKTLQKLTDLSYIAKHNDGYYQSLRTFPKNLKFTIKSERPD